MSVGNAISDPILLFLHIPKTGGTTLSQYLYAHPHFLSRTELPAQTADGFYNYGIYHYPGGFLKSPPGCGDLEEASIAGLPPILAVLGHYGYGVHRLFPFSHYVTILRDPVDRMISLHSHLRFRGLLGDVDLQTFASECPPSGWSASLVGLNGRKQCPTEEDLREMTRAIVDNDQVRRIAGLEPAFGACDRATFEQAEAHLRGSFAIVGTTERFDETLLLLSRLLRSPTTPRYLPNLVNRIRPSREELSQEEREAIMRRNEWDIRLHGVANALLDDAVEAAGPSFQSELEVMRQRNAEHAGAHADAVEAAGLG